jgi:hypothetical protein
MVARELAICQLDLTAVEEVRWDKGSTVRTKEFFFYGKGNKTDQLRT